MPGTRPASPHWTVYAMLVIAVGGILFQGGYLANEIANDGLRITALEARMDKINSIDTRLARMEGKMDVAAARDMRP